MSLYKNLNDKEEILHLYDQKLTSLNIEYQSLDIDTNYGITHILNTGNPTKPPLLIVHGANGCAPIALETYPNLRQKFNIYAVDVLGQPNKSEESRPSMKDLSYGEWLNEVIVKLKLTNVTLVGFSFGGLIILKTLLVDESNIQKAYLAAPAFIVNSNPFKPMIKIFIPMKMYMVTKNIKYLRKFLRQLFTKPDTFAFNYLSKVFLTFDLDFSPVPVIKKENAQRITTPILVFAAENDILFPGRKMIHRIKKIFPSSVQTKLLLGSKHVQNTNDNELIEEQILEDFIF